MRIHPAVAAGLAFTVFMFYALISALHGSVRIDVEPHIGQAPAFVRVKAHVDRDERNRWLDVAIGSNEGYGRESGMELHGPTAPITQWFEYKDVPAGDYTVWVTLYGQGGKQLDRAFERFFISGDR